MKLLRELMIEETFTMNPKDWGIGALDRITKHAAHGDKVARPMTTYLQQRNAAEEEEVEYSDDNTFDPDPIVDKTIEKLYQMNPTEAYGFVYGMVQNHTLNVEQFTKVLTYYGRH